MPMRPILIFPKPAIAERELLNGWRSNSTQTSPGTVWTQCYPKLKALGESFNQRLAHVCVSTSGVEPEMALVMEVVSGIDNFYRCVAQIPGFEWMAEEYIQRGEPAEDEVKDDGRLYLVMSNQSAISQLLTLWDGYHADPNYQFPPKQARFRALFKLLKDIRRWGVEDRLRETGVIEDWQDLLRREDGVSKFEIELWYRQSAEKRDLAEGRLRHLIEGANGRVLARCVVDEIKYHAMRVLMPADEIKKVFESQSAAFVQAEEVMFVRPCGQLMQDRQVCENEMNAVSRHELTAPVLQDPAIAVLDGLPLLGHELLNGRILIDDPDDFSSDYPAHLRVHGTSMASIVIHGDIGANQSALTRKVYMRPIFRPNGHHEEIPENVFAVDLLHRAVKRMFEGEGGGEPTAPHVKIINLSLGDERREFFRDMSPLARMVDWLSNKYNVVFIVSAGNHGDTIRVGVGRTAFESLSEEDQEKVVAKVLYSDVRNRRLLSPAESINAITVGAMHQDAVSDFTLGFRRNLFCDLMPSPVTSVGDGYNRSVKPDLVMFGGRQMYDDSSFGTDYFEMKPSALLAKPGIEVASPGPSGSVRASSFACGTSCSAAMVTHCCGIVHEMVIQMLNGRLAQSDIDKYEPCLLKAMIVHSCGWESVRTPLSRALDIDGSSEDGRRVVSKLIGYGVPDVTRVLECTSNRVTLMGFGELKNGKAHIYNYPLPVGISSKRGIKRLTVTLAWLTPISPSNRKYRNVKLWFKLLSDQVAGHRTDSDCYKVTRGTIQHEVYRNERVLVVSNDENIKIKVSCLKDAACFRDPIKYALLATYETSEEIGVDIYSEIATVVAARTTVPVSRGPVLAR